MLQSVDTLLCAVPSGQPLCRERARESGRVTEISPQTRPSATKTSMITGRARGRDLAIVSPETKYRRADGLKLGSRDVVMVDLCLRPEGVSRPELREALGWKSDPYPSLVAACDKAGVALSVLRGAEPFRYRGHYQTP